jgi:hypothetical protein
MTKQPKITIRKNVPMPRHHEAWRPAEEAIRGLLALALLEDRRRLLTEALEILVGLRRTAPPVLLANLAPFRGVSERRPGGREYSRPAG